MSSSRRGEADSLWLKFATVLAVSVLVIGAAGAGLTGYAYAKRDAILAPIDKVSQMLSDSHFIGTVSGVLTGLKGKLASASALLGSLESGAEDVAGLLEELEALIDAVSASIPYIEVEEPVQQLVDIAGSLPDYVSVPFGPYYDLRDEKQMLHDLGTMINETGQDMNALLAQAKTALDGVSSIIDTVDLGSISASVSGVDLGEVSASIDTILAWAQSLQGGLTQVAAQLLQLRSYAETGILLMLGLCIIIVLISTVLIITLRVLRGVSRRQDGLESEKQLMHIEPVHEDSEKGW